MVIRIRLASADAPYIQSSPSVFQRNMSCLAWELFGLNGVLISIVCDQELTYS
jgi:hypothetical protein